ncbi:hypothetical protein PR202_gb24916 [Eleusine coracana subsp. coracana]|uniref:LEC14B homolog n=1 Tax=Eleusine coracana subsp. coracana TaxID=191504 RepID=A0AAV5FMQ0_ELECO|nr:hypothetical protein PR202_gb24916 [Eleusine coracana subsp. coracana]
MRGVRRSARRESSRKEVCEFEQFTISGEVSHLTRARSQPCHRTRGAVHIGRRKPLSTFELLSARESGRTGGAGFSLADRAYVGRKHIPAKGPWGVDDMDSEAYVSQFSVDGSLLVAGFRVVCWTNFQAYSTLSPIVHIVNVQSAGKESHANITEIHEGLDLAADNYEIDFGIFSVKFSKDGREIVVGNNERSIYVYDLRENKVSVRIKAHKADVNAVTFADESGNILYSGSDDSFCKVSVGQALPFRRKASRGIDSRPLRIVDWDYRWMSFPSEAHHFRHPDDQSLATYRGHSVLRTLIRCYFSPAHSTGQRYIYTGSSDKSVYIYDAITGETVEKLSWHGSIIRDCTWHPYYPTLVTSSWDGYLARWEASGDDDDPSMLAAEEQRPSPYLTAYGDSFLL